MWVCRLSHMPLFDWRNRLQISHVLELNSMLYWKRSNNRLSMLYHLIRLIKRLEFRKNNGYLWEQNLIQRLFWEKKWMEERNNGFPNLKLSIFLEVHFSEFWTDSFILQIIIKLARTEIKNCIFRNRNVMGLKRCHQGVVEFGWIVMVVRFVIQMFRISVRVSNKYNKTISRWKK